MNPLSIVLLIAIIIGLACIMAYLITHKQNGCGYCNGDCKNCEKKYEAIIKDIKKK